MNRTVASAVAALALGAVGCGDAADAEWNCGYCGADPLCEPTGSVIAVLKDSTLTIKGSGRMKNYGYGTALHGNAAPWRRADSAAPITRVVVRSGVTAVGNEAFSGMSSIHTLILPESIDSIGIGAFGYCTALSDIVIPQGVSFIMQIAFYGCSSLVRFDVPQKVREICSGVFGECRSLQKAALPPSLRSIGSAAFENCISLSGITLPEQLAVVESMAFFGCCTLSSIVIPSGAARINRAAFALCSSLESVTCLPAVPPELAEYAFGQVDKTSCTLFVPQGSVDAYRNSAGWRGFAKVEPIAE